MQRSRHAVSALGACAAAAAAASILIAAAHAASPRVATPTLMVTKLAPFVVRHRLPRP